MRLCVCMHMCLYSFSFVTFITGYCYLKKSPLFLREQWDSGLSLPLLLSYFDLFLLQLQNGFCVCVCVCVENHGVFIFINIVVVAVIIMILIVGGVGGSCKGFSTFLSSYISKVTWKTHKARILMKSIFHHKPTYNSQRYSVPRYKETAL